MSAQQPQQKQCADTGALCPHTRRAGPCPTACSAPERCVVWGLGATPVHSSNTARTTLLASAVHLAVASAAVAALIFIVKTAVGA